MAEQNLSKAAQKVQDVLLVYGLQVQVIEMSDSTRTAVEAAQAVGCEVGQIVKSLVFKGKESGKPILVEVSGANRVNEKALSALVGEKIVKPDADFVREQTGFSIGGIPPVGHTNPMVSLIDEDLMQYEVVWAAAGTPNAVFQLTPQDLEKITGGRIIAVK